MKKTKYLSLKSTMLLKGTCGLNPDSDLFSGTMCLTNQQALRRNFKQLHSIMKPEVLTHSLVEMEALTLKECENITLGKTNDKDIILSLLACIESKPDDVFYAFVCALKNNGQQRLGELLLKHTRGMLSTIAYKYLEINTQSLIFNFLVH